MKPKKEEIKENKSAPPDKGKPVEILEFDTMRYHETEEPRLFKAGEEIPEGWQEGRVFGDMVWKPSIEPDANKKYWRKVKV